MESLKTNSQDKIHVEVEGQDQLSWSESLPSPFQHRCCYALTQLIEKYQQMHGVKPAQWPLPEGNSHSEILLRLFLKKLQGSYSSPYEHDEVCHCRSVSTKVIEKAIVNGAHNLETIAAWTTAGTACGTCRVDSQKILDSLLI